MDGWMDGWIDGWINLSLATHTWYEALKARSCMSGSSTSPTEYVPVPLPLSPPSALIWNSAMKLWLTYGAVSRRTLRVCVWGRRQR